jgi:predicted RecA/RadA family phage recombinase
MAFKVGSQTVIDIDSTGATQIQSQGGHDIALYPDSNVWIKEGTKLIFEGTVPDNFEAKLQATSVTADRDIILPDEDGTLATQTYVTNAVTGGTLSNTDALAEGSTNLYYTDARVDARIGSAGANLDLSGKTTTDLAEGTNLYYTDARVDARIAGNTGSSLDLSNKTTTDLAEGSNLYYTTTRANTDFDTRLATKTTANLTEGSNLYFTDERVDDRVANLLVAGTNITLSYDDAAGTLTVNASSTGGYDLSSNTTTDLAEGSNLYYTDARADARITNALGGNVIIGGNLTVSGTTTTVDSNTVNIGDAMITLNADETGTPSQNGGIEIERGTSTNVQIRFNETSDAWEFTNDGSTYIELGTSGTFTGNTDGVNEGTNNLYYTDARVRAAVSATTGSAGYNGSTGAFSIPANTSHISESGNLYYTDARVRTHIEGADLDLGSNKIKYSNVYSQTSDLPSASTYHGMFAHVHGTGKGYFAHAGNWVELANQSNIPTNNNQLTNGAGYVTSSGVTSVATSNGITGGTITSTGTLSMSGSYTGTFSVTGEIRATSDVTAYYSSDEKLKENVVEIDDAINKVKQVRGVEFDWTQEYIDAKGGEDNYFVRKHDVGVIAQEIEKVLPEVVATREDGTKAVKYDRVVALLISAVKEQQKQIEDLKEEINNIRS